MNGVEEKENTEVMPSTYLYVYTKRQNENSNIFVVEYVHPILYTHIFDVHQEFLPFILCKTWTTNF